MPLHDTIQQHVSPEGKTAIDKALSDLETAIKSYVRNLTAEERQRYGSINEKNKLLVNKVWDYRQTQPELSSPDVNWEEFEADYNDRSFIETRMNRIASFIGMMENAKILHDWDNYQNSLTDYSYTQYKADTEAGGYEVKRNELRQFFPNTGGGGTTPDPPTDGGTPTT